MVSVKGNPSLRTVILIRVNVTSIIAGAGSAGCMVIFEQITSGAERLLYAVMVLVYLLCYVNLLVHVFINI